MLHIDVVHSCTDSPAENEVNEQEKKKNETLFNKQKKLWWLIDDWSHIFLHNTSLHVGQQNRKLQRKNEKFIVFDKNQIAKNENGKNIKKMIMEVLKMNNEFNELLKIYQEEEEEEKQK